MKAKASEYLRWEIYSSGLADVLSITQENFLTTRMSDRIIARYATGTGNDFKLRRKVLGPSDYSLVE